MSKIVRSIGRRQRTLALVAGTAIACGSLTACGPDKVPPATTTPTGVQTTGTATHTAIVSPGTSIGRPQQLVGSDGGGYSATVTVTRVWRPSATRISANVVLDVARGTVPASKRWVLVDQSQRSYISGDLAVPIVGHREGTVTFSTPSNVSASYIRFGDAVGTSAVTWTAPYLSRYATSTRTTTKTKTTTKTRSRTTRTKRTTSHR